jgi:hypothetical protein
MQQFLLFQVGGNWQRIYQCQYALLKYLSIYNLKPPTDTGVILYTEQPAAFEAYTSFFPSFQMVAAPLTSKAGLIKETLQKHGGSILYCDTDVYPIKPLISVFQSITIGKAYILFREKHKEATLVKSLLDEYDKKIRGKGREQNEIVLQPAVIGVDEKHLPLIEKADTLTKTPAPASSVEQAESQAFQQAFENEKGNTSWSSFASYQASTAFKELLPAFFQRNAEESIPNLMKLIHHLDAQQIQQEEEQYKQQAFYKRWLDKFTGKGWSIERYKKKF